MTVYFRVTSDPDPTSPWRDIGIGANRTIVKFRAMIDRTVGFAHEDSRSLGFCRRDI